MRLLQRRSRLNPLTKPFIEPFIKHGGLDEQHGEPLLRNDFLGADRHAGQPLGFCASMHNGARRKSPLNPDEAHWLDSFFMSNITPLFYIETLADLEKEVRAGKTPEQVVGEIAFKCTESSFLWRSSLPQLFPLLPRQLRVPRRKVCQSLSA